MGKRWQHHRVKSPRKFLLCQLTRSYEQVLAFFTDSEGGGDPMHKNSSLLCTAHAYTKTAKRTVAQVTRTRASVDQCKPHGLLPPTKRISQMWSTYKKQLIAEYVQKELWLRTAGQLKHLSSLHISTSYKLPNFMTTEGLMLKCNRTIPFQNWWQKVQPKKKKKRQVCFIFAYTRLQREGSYVHDTPLPMCWNQHKGLKHHCSCRKT